MRHFALVRKSLPRLSPGFSIIELMVALLIFSALGLGLATYMRQSNASLSNNDSRASLQTPVDLFRRVLTDDLRQAVYLNPSCAANPASASATVNCSLVQLRGGITPLPGLVKSDVTALTSYGLPASLTSATSSLANPYDAIQILVYDFTGAFNCKLNDYYATANPSATAGTATGAERLWPLRNGCNGNLTTGGLYVLEQSFGTNVFSNVFQITALSDLGGGATSGSQLQADAASTGNLFNQQGGMGLSGFTSAARIYPVKIIQWAFDSTTAAAFRREIRPTTGNLTGVGNWVQVQSGVDGLQFFPFTVTTSGAIEHQRSLQFTSDSANNGIEDIRGVSPRFVLKSSKATTDSTLYDNPFTTNTQENDHYPRVEMKFYVDMKNYHTGT